MWSSNWDWIYKRRWEKREKSIVWYHNIILSLQNGNKKGIEASTNSWQRPRRCTTTLDTSLSIFCRYTTGRMPAISPNNRRKTWAPGPPERSSSAHTLPAGRQDPPNQDVVPIYPIEAPFVREGENSRSNFGEFLGAERTFFLSTLLLDKTRWERRLPHWRPVPDRKNKRNGQLWPAVKKEDVSLKKRQRKLYC
jgi:hypothetical protein